MLLSDYLAVLRGGWKIILGVLIAALAFAVVPALRGTATYSSSTDLFVAASAKDNPENQLQLNAAATQRILSYVEVASGSRAADLVGRQVEDAADASVSAEAVVGTVVLRITATGSDAETVRDVAAAYADVMPRLIAELEDVDDPEAAQVQVSVIDDAELGTPGARSLMPNLVLGLVLGLGLGVATVIVRETLRRERRQSERYLVDQGEQE